MNNVHKSWKALFDKYNFDVDKIYENNEVYPPKKYLFNIFSMDVKEIRILLLGQDPYHRPDQAHGFSFSVPDDEKIPPSLKNIFKELVLEFPERKYNFISGNLDQWVYREHIFLLNCSLSVKKGMPGSHIFIWKDFTNEVIKFINDNNNKCIFLLLGNFAKSKEMFITNKDRIVTEVHPSPLARGFVGSNVFKRVEAKLGHQVNWANY